MPSPITPYRVDQAIDRLLQTADCQIHEEGGATYEKHQAIWKAIVADLKANDLDLTKSKAEASKCFPVRTDCRLYSILRDFKSALIAAQKMKNFQNADRLNAIRDAWQQAERDAKILNIIFESSRGTSLSTPGTLERLRQKHHGLFNGGDIVDLKLVDEHSEILDANLENENEKRRALGLFLGAKITKCGSLEEAITRIKLGTNDLARI